MYVTLEKKQPLKNKAFSDYNINLVIVACVKNPTNFKFWIDYHIDKCNVKKIFLRVQDSPHIKPLLDSYPDIVEPIYINGFGEHASNGYFDIMDWQDSFGNDIIQKIQDDSSNTYTHVAHIDDDELIYFPNGIECFYEELLANPDYYSYFIANIEASYVNKINNIFKTPYFCINRTEYTSYGNGKSIGNLNKNIQLYGPHVFRRAGADTCDVSCSCSYTEADGCECLGNRYSFDSSNIVLLHYESSCIEKWYEKYKSYSMNNYKGDILPIPFKFYKESIEAFKNNIKNKEEVWERYKLVKYRNPNHLIKIDIENKLFI